jgi:hypothetical protein
MSKCVSAAAVQCAHTVSIEQLLLLSSTYNTCAVTHGNLHLVELVSTLCRPPGHSNSTNRAPPPSCTSRRRFALALSAVHAELSRPQLPAARARLAVLAPKGLLLLLLVGSTADSAAAASFIEAVLSKSSVGCCHVAATWGLHRQLLPGSRCLTVPAQAFRDACRSGDACKRVLV